MSAKEFRQTIHELTDQFQVGLSSVEMALMELLPADARKHLLMARRGLKHGIIILHRMQALVDAMIEEERESIQ